MVATALQARVAPDKVDALEQAFREAIQRLDPGIVHTFLLQDSREQSTWRILTIWESAQALESMRQSGAVPRGILMCRTAGAEPSLSMYQIAAHASAE